MEHEEGPHPARRGPTEGDPCEEYKDVSDIAQNDPNGQPPLQGHDAASYRWPEGFEPHPLAAKYELLPKWSPENRGLVADIKATG
jgi:hypothetical protein